MDFSRKVSSLIREQQLCTPGAQLVVGVSGGADSVALLHWLHHNGFRCIVAHCNFHLRGEDSDKDEAFVSDLATKWQLPFFSTGFDTKTIAAQQGISIEMAARDLRYAWFQMLCAEQNAEAIAVAHHADDSLETFFINLARGTGLRGLLGIHPRQGNIIRPFLTVNRKEIINYLQINRLEFQTDNTNFDNTIIRNKIRNAIIPSFEEINPSFREVMAGNFTRLAAVQQVANNCLDTLKEKVAVESEGIISLDISQLKQHGNLSFFLYELLQPYRFNAATVGDILRHLDGESGRQYFSATHRLVKDRQHLLISPLETKDTQTYIVPEGAKIMEEPVYLSLSEPVTAAMVSIERSEKVAFLDYDKLVFPLTLRHPEPGDYFYPFGHSGKKKLSDFFIDQKWNLIQKEKCWLLLSENKIVWIIGHRIDNRFKIDNDSKKTLIIRILRDIV